MIVRQWKQVLDETKTKTRRLHDTYKVGSIQAVVPKYLKPSVWWMQPNERVLMLENPRDYLMDEIGYEVEGWEIKQVNACMESKGWRPGKVLIVDKRVEALQDITEEDAIAEGVIPFVKADGAVRYEVPMFPRMEFLEARDAYRYLWASINTKRGTRWEDNPQQVYVYTFQLVK